MAGLIGLIGLMIGLALGWFAGARFGGTARDESARRARQQALEEEQARLASELSDRDHSLSELSHAAEAALELGQENRRLHRRVRDLETALRTVGNAGELPSAALEIQLVMALKERDAAQKALLDLQGREAVRRNAASPAGSEPEFPDVPEPEFPELPDEPEPDAP